FQAEDGIRDLTVTGVQTCALPISCVGRAANARNAPDEGARLAVSFPYTSSDHVSTSQMVAWLPVADEGAGDVAVLELEGPLPAGDRKSTRLNSSHSQISYAVFCLK